MKLIDWIRREGVIARYDGWMEIYGVPRRRRRAERGDLRANLLEAAEHHGMRAAIEALGHPRDLAKAVGEGYTRGPRWMIALYALLAVFSVQFVALMLSMLAFADGVAASGVTGREVRGGASPWPGAEFTYQETADTLSLSASWPWMPVLPLVVWFVVARPWRLITQRGQVARADA